MAGLQYIVKSNFAGKVFTPEDIEEARQFAHQHFSGNPKCFNYEGWKSLYAKHGGILPLRIKAVKDQDQEAERDEPQLESADFLAIYEAGNVDGLIKV